MKRARPQIFVFTHHKVGTVLFQRILTDLSRRFGLSMRTIGGMARSADHGTDIVLFVHSLIDFDLGNHDYHGVHVVRDPRDVWLSGYLYHQHCDEKWCTNTNLDPAAPIEFPRVPYSQAHRDEIWKRRYLESLGGRSYQQNLLDRDRAEGLRFELDRYASWTIEAMRDWKPRPGEVMELQMERISSKFDLTMRRTLRHLGFHDRQLDEALAIAVQEDASRMSESQIASNPHIHSRKLSKWKEMLPSGDIREIESRFGAVFTQLGYALDAAEEPARLS